MGRGHFLPQGYNLNILGKGPLGSYLPNIKGLGLLVSDKKIFKVFPYMCLCTSGPLVPEKKIFKGFLPYMGVVAILVM